MKYKDIKDIKTIKCVRAVFLIFVLALGLLGCGGDQGGYPPATGYRYIEIEGTVTDKETEGPLGGATVIIEGTDWSATTEDDGSYSISDVEAGIYNIITSKSGYINQTATVTIEDDTTVDFALIALVQYDLTIGSTAGVSVTTPGEGTFTYDAGTVVDLVATPSDGYRFVEWTGDVGTIADVEAAATNITMSGNYSITASSVAVYDLTISSTEGGSVTTPGEGTFTYDAGSVVDLVATPVDGYRFVEWTGDVGTIADVEAAATNITMSGNYSITASSVAVYDLTISSTEGDSVTTPGEGIFTYDAGAIVDLVATPDDGYRFVEWTGDVGTIADVEAAATNITMSGNYSITASSVAVYDLTISSTEGGSATTPGEGTFTYDAGSVVDLVATSDDGYRFVEWTGDVGNIANVAAAATNITMSGNYSVTANFAMKATEVKVDSITYKTFGSGKHLNIIVTLVDDLGDPVAGASVSATLYHNGEKCKEFQGTTKSNGTVTFKLHKHEPGCYYTEVTAIAAEGLKWDGVTPKNGYCCKESIGIKEIPYEMAALQLMLIL